MNEATQHLQSQKREFYRCGLVTIAVHNGNVLLCHHQGRYRGRNYPAHVLYALNGEISKLKELANSIPVVLSGTINRREIQRTAIEDHFAQYRTETIKQDALTTCYFWDH